MSETTNPEAELIAAIEQYNATAEDRSHLWINPDPNGDLDPALKQAMEVEAHLANLLPDPTEEALPIGVESLLRGVVYRGMIYARHPDNPYRVVVVEARWALDESLLTVAKAVHPGTGLYARAGLDVAPEVN